MLYKPKPKNQHEVAENSQPTGDQRTPNAYQQQVKAENNPYSKQQGNNPAQYQDDQQKKYKTAGIQYSDIQNTVVVDVLNFQKPKSQQLNIHPIHNVKHQQQTMNNQNNLFTQHQVPDLTKVEEKQNMEQQQIYKSKEEELRKEYKKIHDYHDLYNNLNLETKKITQNQIQQPSIFALKTQIETVKQLVSKNKDLANKLNSFLTERAYFKQGKAQETYFEFEQNNNHILSKNPKQTVNFQQITRKISEDSKTKGMYKIPLEKFYVQRTEIEQFQSIVQILKKANLKFSKDSFDCLSDPSKLFYNYLLKKDNDLELPIRNEDYFYFNEINPPQGKEFLSVFFDAINSQSKMNYLVSKIPSNQKIIDLTIIEDFLETSASNDRLSITLNIKPVLSHYNKIEKKTTEDYYKDLIKEYEIGQNSDFFKVIKIGKCPPSLFSKSYQQSSEEVMQFNQFFVWMKKVQQKIVILQNFTRARLNLSNSTNSERLVNKKLAFFFPNFVKELEIITLMQFDLTYSLIPFPIQLQESIHQLIPKGDKPISGIYFSVKPDQCYEYLIAGNIVANTVEGNFVFWYKIPNLSSTFVKICAIQSNGTYNSYKPAESNQILHSIDINVKLLKPLEKVEKYNYTITNTKGERNNFMLNEYLFKAVFINKLIQQATKNPSTQNQTIEFSDLFQMKL